MRNIVIIMIVAAVLVGGYVGVSKIRAPLTLLEGQTVRVHRGDLVVPINANGNIKPASITQVKSKASGEVKDIPFEVGSMVKTGQKIVELTTVDEQNAVDRAQADFDRAKIQYETAKISKEQREKVDKPTALSNVEKAQAGIDRAKSALGFQERLKKQDPNQVTEVIWTEVNAALKEANALLAAANADVVRANIASKMADQEISLDTAAVDAAQKVLEDAKQRLKECTIYSPIDGMVLSRNVQKGEVIQGGKTMFTGGTVLMEIADVSQIYSVVNVDEADIGQVRLLAPASARPGGSSQPASSPEGMTEKKLATLPAGIIEKGEPVEITVESFKDEKFKGEIERISPQSEIVAAIATFKVWIRITTNKEKLVGLLNTQAEAHFSAHSVRDALLVSYDAFQKDPNGDAFGVYVPVKVPGKDRAEAKFKKCRFGGDNGIDVEVKEGLKEGDLVYTKLPQKTQKEQEAEEKAEKK